MELNDSMWRWDALSVHGTKEHIADKQYAHALAQAAEAFVHHATSHVEPDPPVTLRLQPKTHDAYDVEQWLVQLGIYLLGCERVGIATLGPKTASLKAIADTDPVPDHKQRWWSTIRRLLSHTTQGSTHLSQLRRDQIVLHDIFSQSGDEDYNDERHMLLIAPIQADEHLTGLLCAEYGDHERAVAPETLILGRALAKLAAMAIQHGRLVREQAKLRESTVALRKVSNQTDAVLGLICHELKTPLTTIKMSVQLAKRQIQRMERLEGQVGVSAGALASVEELLEVTDRQVGIEDRLASDLLDMTRIRSGKLDIRRVSCDLATIVQDVVAAQRVAWPRRIIYQDFPYESVPVWIDPDRIAQVVINYLTNALKYSPEDQPVEVEVRIEPRVARVLVRDHGVGLPKWERKRIWERFYQARGVQVQSGSGIGLGLGLYLCRSMIQQQGGRVGVTSALGRGSTFWFTLPLHAASAT